MERALEQKRLVYQQVSSWTAVGLLRSSRDGRGDIAERRLPTTDLDTATAAVFAVAVVFLLLVPFISR